MRFVFTNYMNVRLLYLLYNYMIRKNKAFVDRELIWQMPVSPYYHLYRFVFTHRTAPTNHGIINS